MRYELTDHEWTASKPFLPNKPRGVPRVNDRRVLNGIFWVLRSGAPWRDVPDNFGPYTTCYNRFVRRRRAGVWSRIMNALATAHDAAVQMIDTSIVRVHQHAACIARNKRQSMGRSRGGLTSKIHAVVDSSGLPVRLALTTGEAHDNRLAGKLLSRLKSGTMLLADRGYDADWIRALVRQHGAWANIPPKRNRTEALCFSPYLYKPRNLVERFFNKIKHCRRVATRYDRLAANYLAFVQLASIRLWLRLNESAFYFAWGCFRDLDLGSGSGDHDPAAQHGAGGAAELAQQSRLGTAGIGGVAAEPLIMIARNQQALFCRGTRDQAAEKFEAVPEPRIGVGRSGVAKDTGARASAARDALDELAGFFDPAGIEHRAGMQEHQPWAAGLARAGRHRSAARSFERQESASRDIGHAFDDVGVGPVDQQHLAHQACGRSRHQRRKGGDGGVLDTLSRNNDA